MNLNKVDHGLFEIIWFFIIFYLQAIFSKSLIS